MREPYIPDRMTRERHIASLKQRIDELTLCTYSMSWWEQERAEYELKRLRFELAVLGIGYEAEG